MGGTQSNCQSTSNSNPVDTEENFKIQVRTAAEKFQNIVHNNKVAIFSATYCSYCTVAKHTFDEIGTKYATLELNQMSDGDMMMSVLSAVTGNRTVPAIFICGQLIPGGGSGLRHLASNGELVKVLEKCCDGDVTCSKYDI